MKNVATKPKCKKQLRAGWGKHNCSRNAVKDGFCRTHHPDAVEKRAKIAAERFNAKEANSIPARFERAQERITELEEKKAKLWQWVEKNCFLASTGRTVIRVDHLKEYLGILTWMKTKKKAEK